ncbi:uncharacterized protein LOC122829149 [Gambusia affinis]|uniref:uncharacterized protein LOC122829149 n=1 Tax=Gambusia affinis TaxID=33528 RepID=UPI001CDCFB25|nr:uncharacterized protein LOC122829149 [Gambusia affinis]
MNISPPPDSPCRDAGVYRRQPETAETERSRAEQPSPTGGRNCSRTGTEPVSPKGRHADDIFGKLFLEASSFYLRMSWLQERVETLGLKVKQLDSTVEEGGKAGRHTSEHIITSVHPCPESLQDINLRKTFRSSTSQDQQVVSRCSILTPLLPCLSLTPTVLGNRIFSTTIWCRDPDPSTGHPRTLTNSVKAPTWTKHQPQTWIRI